MDSFCFICFQREELQPLRLHRSVPWPPASAAGGTRHVPVGAQHHAGLGHGAGRDSLALLNFLSEQAHPLLATGEAVLCHAVPRRTVPCRGEAACTARVRIQHVLPWQQLSRLCRAGRCRGARRSRAVGSSV